MSRYKYTKDELAGMLYELAMLGAELPEDAVMPIYRIVATSSNNDKIAAQLEKNREYNP